MTAGRYQKDEEVPGWEDLWRHIPSLAMKFDPMLKRLRPSSANFKCDNMSVDIASLTTVEKSLRLRAGQAICQFGTQVLIDWNKKVIADPFPPENPTNDAHAIVPEKLSKTQANKLAKRAIWVEGATPVGG